MEADRGGCVMMELRDEEIGHVMKGKRTKRLRLQSSMAFSISPSQSDEAFLEDHNNGGSNVFCSSSSLDQIQTSSDEEEEEQDLAYCLIRFKLLVGTERATRSSKRVPPLKTPKKSFNYHSQRSRTDSLTPRIPEARADSLGEVEQLKATTEAA